MSEIVIKLEDLSLQSKQQNVDSITKIGIIGMGKVSQEIIKNVSRSGFDVVAYDIESEDVTKGLNSISEMLDLEIKSWGMTNSDKRLILSRIQVTSNIQDFSDCDVIIETANSYQRSTSLENRKEILQKVEAVVKASTVLLTNSSTILISALAEALTNPERLIGVHFLSPSDKIKIVEVVRSKYSQDNYFEKAIRFVKMLEKDPIELSEYPGNISTRINCLLINQACEMLMEGITSIENIDKIMKEGMGFQNGPFELADRIGLDKIQGQMDNLYNEFGDKSFKCSQIIKRLVRKGKTGKAVGFGFYKYDENGKIIDSTISFPDIKA